MWFLMKMLKVSWTEKKTNQEILVKANTRRKLMQTIRKMQLEFFGHIMRKNGLEKLVTTGKVEGRRARGKQRMTFIKSLLGDMKDITSAVELIQATNDRELWRSMVANVVIQGT